MIASADPVMKRGWGRLTAAGRPMNRAVGAFVKLVRAREWGGAAA